MKMMTRILAALATILMFSGLFAGTSSAGFDIDTYLCDELNIGCPPSDGNVAVDNANPGPGEQVTLTGSGCEPGSAVTFVIDGEVVGSGVTGDDGTFAVDVTAPMKPGTYVVEGTCGSLVLDSVTITVGGEVTGVLARTGSNVGSTVAVGASLVLLGAAAVYGTRKRRSIA